MKRISIIVFFLLTFFSACTKTGEPQMHPNAWLITGESESHMAKISESGTESCQVCHGEPYLNDYYGGSSGVSCYECHKGGPSGHPAWNEWMEPESDESHGTLFLDRGVLDCGSCHGLDLTGRIATGCDACHTNQELQTWLD